MAQTEALAAAEVEAYLHRARSMILDVFGGEAGREQTLATVQLASAMVQADAALRMAAANDRLAAALLSLQGD